MSKEKVNKTNIVHGIATLFIALPCLFVIISSFIPFTSPEPSKPSDFYSAFNIVLTILFFYLTYISIYTYKRNKKNFLKYTSLIAIILFIMSEILDIVDFLFFDYKLFDNIILSYIALIILITIIIASLLNLLFLFKEIKKIPLKKYFLCSAWLEGIAIISFILGIILANPETPIAEFFFYLFIIFFAVFGFFGGTLFIGTMCVLIYKKFSSKKRK
jgi:hypothetical protein